MNRENMNRDNVKFLEWFVRFGQADIEGASLQEKRRWATDFHAMVSEGIILAADFDRFERRVTALPNNKGYPPDRTVDAMQRAHSVFSTMFLEIAERLRAVFGPGGSGLTPPEGVEAPDFGGQQLPAQVVEAGRRANELLAALQIESIRSLLEIFGHGLKLEVDVAAYIDGLYQSPIVKMVSTCHSNAGKMLCAMFFKFLDGVPLTNFKWCPECGKMFVHATRRKRVFCSNACAARKGGREHRHRLKNQRPEAYEKEKRKGAARARRSYVKRLREKGVPGKPAQRPYKHKED